MKTADQVQNQRNGSKNARVPQSQYASESPGLSGHKMLDVTLGISPHAMFETQQLGYLASVVVSLEETLCQIAMKLRHPRRRIEMAYAIDIAKAIAPLNLMERPLSVNLSDPGPRPGVPAVFNVWPASLGTALETISAALQNNFAEIVRKIESLPPFFAAELAGALHVAHTVHRARNGGRDLKSGDLLRIQLDRWADEKMLQPIARRTYQSVPVLSYARA